MEVTTMEADEDFLSGPLSILTKAVKGEHRVLISLRNNKKLLDDKIFAFDRHYNMILENVTEMWWVNAKPEKTAMAKEEDEIVVIEDSNTTAIDNITVSNLDRKNKISPQRKDRYLKKMFLRGDSVILCAAYKCKKN
jgi:small nuclear ribonucleoprotein D2